MTLKAHLTLEQVVINGITKLSLTGKLYPLEIPIQSFNLEYSSAPRPLSPTNKLQWALVAALSRLLTEDMYAKVGIDVPQSGVYCDNYQNYWDLLLKDIRAYMGERFPPTLEEFMRDNPGSLMSYELTADLRQSLSFGPIRKQYCRRMSMTDHQIHAPFTLDQVEILNRYQSLGLVHEFTCGKCGSVLFATPEGWVCSAYGCDYTQEWAHTFMSSEEYVRNLEGIRDQMYPRTITDFKLWEMSGE